MAFEKRPFSRSVHWRKQEGNQNALPNESLILHRKKMLDKLGFHRIGHRADTHLMFSVPGEKERYEKLAEFFSTPEGFILAQQIHKKFDKQYPGASEIIDILSAPSYIEALSLRTVRLFASLCEKYLLDDSKAKIGRIFSEYFIRPPDDFLMNEQNLKKAERLFAVIYKGCQKAKYKATYMSRLELLFNGRHIKHFTPENIALYSKQIKMVTENARIREAHTVHRVLVPALLKSKLIGEAIPLERLGKTLSEIAKGVHEMQFIEQGSFTDEDAVAFIASVYKQPNVAEKFSVNLSLDLCKMLKKNEHHMAPEALRFFEKMIGLKSRVFGEAIVDDIEKVVLEANALCEVSGRASSLVSIHLESLQNYFSDSSATAGRRTGRLIEEGKDEGSLFRFLKKHLRGSVPNARLFENLNRRFGLESKVLRFFAQHKPALFIKALESFSVAESFGLTMGERFSSLVNPFQISSKEELGDLVFPESAVRERLESFVVLYKKLATKQQAINPQKLNSMISEMEDFKKSLLAKATNKDFVSAQKVALEMSATMGGVVTDYLVSVLDKKIEVKAKKEFGSSIDIERLRSDEFIGPYKILQRMRRGGFGSVTQKDIEIAQKVLSSHLLKQEGPLTKGQENVQWLERVLGDRRELWMSDNHKSYDVTSQSYESNIAERIEHHRSEAQRIIEKMGGVNSAALSVDDIFLKYSDLKNQPDNTSRSYKLLLSDLATQVSALKSMAKEKGLQHKTIKKITIRKETDPVRIVNMGKWVSGSCLDADGSNAWSAFVNASEANKGVLWITDQDENILARVLIAIDENKSIVRFPMYYSTTTVLNLNSYVNDYIKGLAQKLNLGVNGSGDKVKILTHSNWYRDRHTPNV